MPYSFILAQIAIALLFLIAGYLLRKEGGQIFFGYGVPFVPSGDYKVKGLLENIEFSSQSKFLDLGCGDGKILQAIKLNFPDVDVTGIEAAPYPYGLAKKKQLQNGLDYTLIKANFFKQDFSEYDVIYSYMIPYLMKNIWKKIKKECRAGTLFYSNAFEIKGEEVYKKVTLKKGNYLYVYRVGEKK